MPSPKTGGCPFKPSAKAPFTVEKQSLPKPATANAGPRLEKVARGLDSAKDWQQAIEYLGESHE